MGKVRKLGTQIPQSQGKPHSTWFNFRIFVCPMSIGLVTASVLLAQNHYRRRTWCPYANMKHKKAWISFRKQAKPRVKSRSSSMRSFAMRLVGSSWCYSLRAITKKGRKERRSMHQKARCSSGHHCLLVRWAPGGTYDGRLSFAFVPFPWMDWCAALRSLLMLLPRVGHDVLSLWFLLYI